MRAGHPGGPTGRIVGTEDYLSEIWLRPALRGQHLKGPMDPDLRGTWLACQQGDRSFAKWTAIFGHRERSFVFLAKFAKDYEAASTGLTSSKTRSAFDFGYFGVSNAPYTSLRLKESPGE